MKIKRVEHIAIAVDSINEFDRHAARYVWH